MTRPLPLRPEQPPDDAVLLLRAGVMSTDGSSKEEPVMPKEYDIAVDFMDMTDDRRLWARAVDFSRSGRGEGSGSM